MAEPNKRQKASGILGDHVRVGKKFIPPFLNAGFSDVSWVTDILPELFWIGLLIDRNGLARAGELALRTVSAAREAWGEQSSVWFCDASSYLALTDVHRAAIVSTLEASQVIDEIRRAIVPLVFFYPACPLAFMCTGLAVGTENVQAELAWLKGTLGSMFDRRGRPATMVQAHAVYVAMASGHMKVTDNVETLAKSFAAVEVYPDTPESERVGASVRAAVTAMIGIQERSQGWAKYFWNRGLVLEPCEVRK